MKEELEKCTECEICIDVCPSYLVKKEKMFSPFGRIQSLKELLSGKYSEQIEKSLLTCNGCGRCKQVCPLDIDVGGLVTAGRNILYKKGIIPKDAQRRIIESILEKGNAVLREEEKRVIYGSEYYRKFLENESDTILFFGCISSFLNKDAVYGAVKILESLEVDFRIIKEEGCCGIFLYDGGYFDKAEEVFVKNAKRFKDLGIRRIIVLCPSCYKSFKIYYPEVLKDFPFEVVHLIEVMEEELKKGKSIKAEGSFFLHEPCKITRTIDLSETVRYVLNKVGISFFEFKENRSMSLCCGAGSGLRTYDLELSLRIADLIISYAKRDIITLCPFCNLNLNHALKKKGEKIRSFYISELFS